MATTPITKTANPTNMTGLRMAAEGASFFEDSHWTAVPSGANNGVTFAYQGRDLVFLGMNTNATIGFTLKIPETADETTYGLTRSDVSVSVSGEFKEVKAFRVTDIFKASTNLVTIEANTTGGFICVMQG